MPGQHFLQLPGPTNVPASILRAMHRPAEDFTSASFRDMAAAAIDSLKPIFGTDGEIFAFVAIGHGVWEAVLTNLIDCSEAVLIPETGRFSEGWRDMARALDIETLTIPGDWQSPINPDLVEQTLKADTDRRIKAVFATHIETSTGAVSDLAAIRAAIDAADHPALLVVDAIASLAVTPIEMDRNRIDCAIAASQKGLMMPPGLSFAALNDKGAAASKACKRPRRYWDWLRRRGDETYLWFYGTPPVQQLYGLEESIRLLNTEGLPAVYQRHRRLAATVRAAIKHWSQSGQLCFNCPQPAHRSDAVTAVRFDPKIDIEALRDHCRHRYNVSFAGGLGTLFGKIMRIGHLGDLNEAMILGALGALELTMHDHKVEIAEGGLDAAICALKREHSTI